MDADGFPLWIIVFLLLFLLGGAYFAATEIAFTAMNRLRVKNAAEEGDMYAKKAVKVSDDFDNALTVILIGNNIMHVGSASLATMLATRLWGSGSVAVTTLVMTAIVFLFCETLPKAYAKHRPEQFAMRAAPSLCLLMKILKPIARLFAAFADAVSKLFPTQETPSYTEDELEDIMETIEDEGVLDEEKQELVQSAYEFGKKVARDILIPMDQVACIDVRSSADEIAMRLSKYKYSRFPVYDGSVMNPIGILQANRFYAARLKGEFRGIRPLLFPLRSYAADMVIDDMMTEMNRRRQHMALVTEQDGKILGIATMEDILEELVGDIYDEDDVRS